MYMEIPDDEKSILFNKFLITSDDITINLQILFFRLVFSLYFISYINFYNIP